MGELRLIIRMAINNLLGNKLRSFLTMLGIIIGIAAVIAIISLGAGAQSLITNALKNLGTDTLTVLPGNSDESGPPAQALGISVNTLVEDDADAIGELSFVEEYSGFSNGTGEMVFLTRYLSGNYSGVRHTYPELENHTLEAGRFFTEQERTFTKKCSGAWRRCSRHLVSSHQPGESKNKNRQRNFFGHWSLGSQRLYTF